MSIRDTLREIQDKVDIYLSVERFQVAEKLILGALKELGDLANLHNLLGLTYHRQSRFNDAIASFENARRINPKFIEPILNLTIIHLDLGLYEEAERFYEQAKNSLEAEDSQLSSLLVGRLANMHAETARAYEKVGLVGEAIKEFEKATALYPNMPDIILHLAQLEIQNGRRDRAQSYLLDMERRFSPDPLVQNFIGLIAYQNGDYVEAKSRWRKAQEIHPEDRLSKSYLRCLEHLEFAGR